MSLDQKFEEAARRVKAFTKRPKDDDLLEVYSYYKQATIGDCNIGKPSDVEGCKKWDAWNARRGMDKDSAKRAYIDRTEQFGVKYD